MKKMLIMMGMLLLAGSVVAEIKAELSFSTDKGKTWEKDFPILKNIREFMVKTEYQVEENREFTSNPVITVNLSSDRDFDNANRGGQRWSKDKQLRWYQRPTRYYQNVKKPGNFVLTVSLAERQEGTMGLLNKWDKELKKFVDAPLPPLKAYEPGSYSFLIELTYHVKDNNGGRSAVQLKQHFDVVVEE